jgi:hypothetical protein
MTNLYEHTVWCWGTHNRDGECIKEAKVGQDRDDAVVRLNGVPGDHQYIEVEGVLTEPEHVDAAVAILTQCRADLAAQNDVEAQLDWDAYDAGAADEGR